MSRPVLPDGYTVKFMHLRDTIVVDDAIGETKVSPQGGRTIANIFDENGNVVASAVAICRQDESFNKRIGRDVSLGRALKMLEWEVLEF